MASDLQPLDVDAEEQRSAREIVNSPHRAFPLNILAGGLALAAFAVIAIYHKDALRSIDATKFVAVSPAGVGLASAPGAVGRKAPFASASPNDAIAMPAIAVRVPKDIVMKDSEEEGGKLSVEDRMQKADDIILDAEEQMTNSIAACAKGLGSLQVGRATPSMLDRIQVSAYEMMTPLNQLATITAPDASLLVIDLYDKSIMRDVERAIIQSDLGMTPSSDGKVIRINVPPLTTETRKEMAKTVKKLGEDTKVSIRNARKNAQNKIKKMKGDLGDDTILDKEDNLQKAVKKYEKQIEDMISKKEKDITTV